MASTMGAPQAPWARDNFRAPGRFPHRFIQDFLASGLADENEQFQVGCAAASQPHAFETMPQQSCTTTISPDDHKSHSVPMIVSAFCSKCRYHFAFRLEAPTGGSMCCSFGNREFPLHHLVRSTGRAEDYASCDPDYHRNPEGKYLRCRGHQEYCCTNQKQASVDVERCSFRFVVEISEPRLPDAVISFLTDEDAFGARYDREFAQDPERFRKVKREMQAARYLAVYLSDVVKEKDKRRSNHINVRNVKFATNFGNDHDANELFTWLEFSKSTTEDGMELWVMPTYDHQFPTVVPTRQSFFQDILCELRAITNQPIHEASTQSLESQLYSALHCTEADTGIVEVKGETILPFGSPADYAVLGLTARTHWRILEFAFDRQANSDPDNWSRYFDALKNIGAAVNQEQLNMRIAMLESSRDFGSVPTGHFSMASTVTTDPLANEYRLKFAHARTGKERMALRLELRDVARTSNGGEAAFAQFMEAQPMDLLEAQAFLDIEASFDELRAMEVAKIQNRAFNKDQLAKAGPVLMGNALKKVAEIRKSDELEALAQDLISGTVMMELDDQVFDTSSVNDTVDLKLPAGLKNITNTCYLNSILQYLFTIPTVRDLVLRHELYRLPDSDEARRDRRVATKQSGISTAEYFVAEKFVGELQLLFSNLLASKLAFTEPTQKLAISAMNTAQRLANRDSKSAAAKGKLAQSPSGKAPPLPARPPKPRETSLSAESNVSYATLAETEQETLVDSTRSSPRQSLIGDTTNVIAGEGSEPAKAPVKATDEAAMISRIDDALNDGSISGTDQEDVQEVMSNMLQHLQAVTKATGHDDDTGTQTDPVTDLFFLTKVTHRQRLSPTGKFEWQQSVTPEAYLIAYPELVEDRRAISLHEALHKSLELEHVNAKAASDDSWLSYGSIRKLPPILHICIQRSADIGNRKNGTVITIPLVLYMDRYKESGPDEDLHQLRNYFWGLRLRIADQETRRTVQKKLAEAKKNAQESGWPADDDEEVETAGIGLFTRMASDRQAQESGAGAEPMGDGLPATAPVQATTDPGSSTAAMSSSRSPTHPGIPESNAMTIGSTMVVDHEEDGVELIRTDASSSPSPSSSRVVAQPEHQHQQEDRADSFPVSSMVETAEHLFDHLTEEEYHLHAVICHGGAGTGAGHYWVWIRDFERGGIWHKYNDRTVTSHAEDDPAVVDMLTRSEHPYYLAYVRGGGAGDFIGDAVSYVSVPRRDLG